VFFSRLPAGALLNPSRHGREEGHGSENLGNILRIEQEAFERLEEIDRHRGAEYRWYALETTMRE
jgi:hypothetical protein